MEAIIFFIFFRKNIMSAGYLVALHSNSEQLYR
jgi:hypothetical protein